MERVLISHGEVAATTERDEVINGGCATLGLGDIVAGLEVEDVYDIFAPGGFTPLFKSATAMMDPDGFTQGAGDTLLLILASHLLHVL